MSTQIKRRRGSESEIALFTPAVAEWVHNTTDNSIHVGDGVKAGGHKILPTSDVPNVIHYGAIEGGVIDCKSAFTAAVSAAKAINNSDKNEGDAIAYADSVEVYVPEGIYLLNDYVVNNGVIPTFHCAANVKFINSHFLEGRIDKDGYHINSVPKGILENASGFSTRLFSGGYKAGTGLDEDGGTFGISDESQLVQQGLSDSVTLTAQNIYGTELRTITGTTFTATSVAFTSVSNTIVENICVGSFLWQETSKAFGVISDINYNTKVITVLGWYRQGVGVGTPIDGDPMYIDALDKIWGQNTNVQILNNETTISGSGYEMGVSTVQTVSANVEEADIPYLWGFDSSSLPQGSEVGSIAFQARNDWYIGFLSKDQRVGFQTFATDNDRNTVGFLHKTRGNTAFQSKNPDTEENGISLFANGQSKFGYGDSSETLVFTDYRTKNNNYDVRLLISGGDAGTVGQGALTVSSITADFTGIIRPALDNDKPLGGASNRFTQVFAVSGTINTSDEREKQQVQTSFDKVLDAWANVPKVMFKWNDSVEIKGDDARWHCGVLAQDIIREFEKAGLNAYEHGVLCYDEWEEQIIEHPEVTDYKLDINGHPISEMVLDTEGNPVMITVKKEVIILGKSTGVYVDVEIEKTVFVMEVQEEAYTVTIPAGNRYGVRYAEAAQLDAALERRERAKLEAKINQLMM